MRKSIVLLFSLFIALTSHAKNHNVHMHNNLNGQSMVFEPLLVEASIGDTISFIPKSIDHIPQSAFVPENGTSWAGKAGEKIVVTLSAEGFYVYECKNHRLMGMVGMIRVGKMTNIKQTKEFLSSYNKKLIMNKTRLSDI